MRTRWTAAAAVLAGALSVAGCSTSGHATTTRADCASGTPYLIVSQSIGADDVWHARAHVWDASRGACLELRDYLLDTHPRISPWCVMAAPAAANPTYRRGDELADVRIRLGGGCGSL